MPVSAFANKTSCNGLASFCKTDVELIWWFVNWKCKISKKNESIDAHKGGDGGRGMKQHTPRPNFQKKLVKKCNKRQNWGLQGNLSGKPWQKSKLSPPLDLSSSVGIFTVFYLLSIIIW